MYCAVEKHPDFGGMSLRHYFAGQALAGLAGNFSALARADIEMRTDVDVSEMLAVNAYAMADAMLAAQEGGQRHARPIAPAPDLFEALHAAEAELQLCTRYHHAQGHKPAARRIDATIATIRAAIAKAERSVP